ncbi:hypothetical protein AVDCRST_MAG81-1012 [uncultured Synechococcales cyanobacterium]|uniref:Uncharacterized protein n=1 Tax=uncultured Synechococcales cyanobacterium TaxID=1936017 RepID=A0A6J4V0R3_9CYAN|nr:hypothetical protein AVDCRST_MAG81-1012 [uncultured Synechococcales cyanobacterium]
MTGEKSSTLKTTSKVLKGECSSRLPKFKLVYLVYLFKCIAFEPWCIALLLDLMHCNNPTIS